MKKKNNILTIVVYLFVAALVIVAIGTILSSFVCRSSNNEDSATIKIESPDDPDAPTKDGSDEKADKSNEGKDETDSNIDDNNSSSSDKADSKKDNKGSSSDSDINSEDVDEEKPLTEHDEDADAVIEIPFDVFQEE